MNLVVEVKIRNFVDAAVDNIKLNVPSVSAHNTSLIISSEGNPALAIADTSGKVIVDGGGITAGTEFVIQPSDERVAEGEGIKITLTLDASLAGKGIDLNGWTVDATHSNVFTKTVRPHTGTTTFDSIHLTLPLVDGNGKDIDWSTKQPLSLAAVEVDAAGNDRGGPTYAITLSGINASGPEVSSALTVNGAAVDLAHGVNAGDVIDIAVGSHYLGEGSKGVVLTVILDASLANRGIVFDGWTADAAHTTFTRTVTSDAITGAYPSVAIKLPITDASGAIIDWAGKPLDVRTAGLSATSAVIATADKIVPVNAVDAISVIATVDGRALGDVVVEGETIDIALASRDVSENTVHIKLTLTLDASLAGKDIDLVGWTVDATHSNIFTKTVTKSANGSYETVHVTLPERDLHNALIDWNSGSLTLVAQGLDNANNPTLSKTIAMHVWDKVILDVDATVNGEPFVNGGTISAGQTIDIGVSAHDLGANSQGVKLTLTLSASLANKGIVIDGWTVDPSHSNIFTKTVHSVAGGYPDSKILVPVRDGSGHIIDWEGNTIRLAVAGLDGTGTGIIERAYLSQVKGTPAVSFAATVDGGTLGEDGLVLAGKEISITLDSANLGTDSQGVLLKLTLDASLANKGIVIDGWTADAAHTVFTKTAQKSALDGTYPKVTVILPNADGSGNLISWDNSSVSVEADGLDGKSATLVETSLHLNVQTSASDTPVFTGVYDSIGNSTGYLDTGAATDDTLLALTGTGAVGATVVLYDGDKQLGTATVGADGHWLFHTSWLTDGETYTFKAAYHGSTSFTDSRIITIDAPWAVAPETQGALGTKANSYAFAALKADGSVVTWGDAAHGGDISAVAVRLSSGVKEVFSSDGAFAALKADGSVVTWGAEANGGDSSAVAAQLSSGVVEVFGTSYAFAALKADGSVVTWGPSARGGDSSAVAAQLSGGVEQVFSTVDAFAALKADGSVVTWGAAADGGDSTSVANQLSSGVQQVFSTVYAFAALKVDGSVVTWGTAASGGDSTAVSAKLSSGVVQVFANGSAFAALKADGSVVTWGTAANGGDSTSVAEKLSSGVVQVFKGGSAFAALKSDGSVVTWGIAANGGDSSSVANQLSGGVKEVFSNNEAFAALKNDGSVVTWGTAAFGGNSSTVAQQLSSGVVQIVQTPAAFAALKADGSVVTWGTAGSGGDSSAVAEKLSSGVQQIYANGAAFAALKSDGTVVTWGAAADGGLGNAVSAGLTNVVGLSSPRYPLDAPLTLYAVDTSADGKTIILSYNEELNAGSTPPASAFTVKVDGETLGANDIARVSVEGATVKLTLVSSKVIAVGQSATVTYTAPEAGNAAIQDKIGNAAVSVNDRGIANKSSYTDPGSDNKYDVYRASGDDTTQTLRGNLADYALLDNVGAYVNIGKPGAVVDSLVGFEHLAFKDGSISLATDSALFDPVFYAISNPDVYRAGVDLQAHFQQFGKAEGRNPNALFDAKGYLAVNTDVAAAGINAYDHFVANGAAEGRDASANFDIRYYLVKNPDVAAAGINALEHYLAHGRAEGRETSKAIGQNIRADSFDEDYYLLANADIAAAGIDAQAHFDQFGSAEGRAANAYFDPAYYLAHNADVAAAGIDALAHYNANGWREGRAASEDFNTAAYLHNNPDIAAADINPLTHYLQYGIYEGRSDESLNA
ncbi:SwmB domain-containing protein [Pseudochelatococcus contaminans]|uniref:Putative repeat protein (TIGR02059 family) n=1 Tax=Pseudochelatococcus contaminans TaxID=1538103 RepID=A0A7W6EGS9_9HYPH|nr:SwmB domain-containing protein [Pseudochelatococcus contaminans]MBB3809674.1 putative repeat protein (TIGR02059 family) [Pseudochelatococcus contaminans]